MGLDFRKRSGRIANGSLLIVPGQTTNGIKVYQTTFSQKKSQNDKTLGPESLISSPTPTLTNTPTPTPTLTNTPTPTPTPTNTPTPMPYSPIEILIDPILTENNEYIVAGNGEYLMFVNP
jgi:hypothetical protein